MKIISNITKKKLYISLFSLAIATSVPTIIFSIKNYEKGVSDIDITKKAISNLNEKNFNIIIKNDDLSTSVQNEEIYNVLISIPEIQKLSETQRSLLKQNMISTNYFDGYVEIIINNFNKLKKIRLNGFLTTSSKNAKLIENAVSSLDQNDLKNLIDDQNLSTSVDKTTLYNFLISTPKIQTLTPEVRNLFKESDLSINYFDGSLQVVISNHGINKSIMLDGFLKNAVKAAREIKEIVQQLPEETLGIIVNKDELPTNINRNNIYDLITKNLNDEQKNLINIEDINIEYFDDYLEIIISNHGPDKSITLDGFMSSKSNDANVVRNAIQSLSEKDFKDLANPDSLSSKLAKHRVFSYLKSNIQSIKKLTKNQKALLSSDDIELIYLDGSIEVIISNHGPEKALKINGFLKNADKDAKALELVIQKLNNNDFTGIRRGRKPSKVTKQELFNQILNNRNFKKLTQKQKELFDMENDISLKVLHKIYLSVSINNHGPKKGIFISGFRP